MYGGAATLVAATILATIQTGYLIPIGISPLHILGAVLLVLGYVMRQRALKSDPYAREQTRFGPRSAAASRRSAWRRSLDAPTLRCVPP